jgi:hypothetical protein
MRNKKHLISAVILSLLITISFAHSGRTDSSGGHKDNKNVSGLGSYHYHCGGYPAHLHTNGVCPYTSPKITYPTTPVAPIKPIVPTTPSVETQVTLSTKTQVDVPTYAVKINGQDISNFSMGWKPFVYENITYIPMTSYLVNALNLNLNFDNVNGFNLSAKSGNENVPTSSDYSDYFYIYKTASELKEDLINLQGNFADAFFWYSSSYEDRFCYTLLQGSLSTIELEYDLVKLSLEKEQKFIELCVKHNILSENEAKELFKLISAYNNYIKTTAQQMEFNAKNFDYSVDFSDDTDLSRTILTQLVDSLLPIQNVTSSKF